MTREEARDQIVIFMCDEQKVINDRDKQALDMAIEALEQEPCEDAISRKEAANVIFKYAEEYFPLAIAFEMENDINALPSVEPSRPHEMKEALEQKLYDDAISKEAVINALGEWIVSGEYQYTNATDYLVKRIKGLPPITPQTKTGHWIAVENEEMETVGYYCSECDLPMETEQRTNFCPNCGAKMESEDSNDVN